MGPTNGSDTPRSLASLLGLRCRHPLLIAYLLGESPTVKYETKASSLKLMAFSEKIWEDAGSVMGVSVRINCRGNHRSIRCLRRLSHDHQTRQSYQNRT